MQCIPLLRRSVLNAIHMCIVTVNMRRHIPRVLGRCMKHHNVIMKTGMLAKMATTITTII